MRESCSCGAGIHSWRYRHLLEWRYTHIHDDLHQADLESSTDLATPHPVGFTPEIPAEEEEEC